MAHQDYVSRSQNKKKSPYKKSNQAVESAFPTKFKIISLVTLLLIAAFGYGLWSIKDNNTNAPIENKQISTKKNQSSSGEKALPAPPKEEWSYVDELKTKEVEEGQYTVTNKGPYKMQCGSFRTRKQAEVLKANIAFAGLSSQISESKGSNGTYFKVFLGPYERKRSAEKDKHKLKNNNINYCQIWLWK